jgi:pyridoxine 5-phosphate synthase
MVGLSVNVDHIATIRQARRGEVPDPVTAATIAELAGADGIIVHLREDRRHIQDRDLKILRETVKIKLNMEMAAVEEIIRIALEIKPDMVTLVPEKREELTTEGGLEVNLRKEELKEVVKIIQDSGIMVSLFVDPDPDQVKASYKIGADCVEIHTGAFCDARKLKEKEKEFQRIEDAVKIASKLKLKVHAGHGIDYISIKKLATIQEIEEFSIGHSIIARAVLVGLDRAVREMAALINGFGYS